MIIVFYLSGLSNVIITAFRSNSQCAFRVFFLLLLLLLEIADAFKLFDKNGDGQISVEELGEAMKQAGQELPEEELKDMIRAVDRNGTSMLFAFVYCKRARMS